MGRTLGQDAHYDQDAPQAPHQLGAQRKAARRTADDLRGRTLNKALKSADLPTEFSKWTRKAQDRAMWRKLSKSVQ